MRRDVLISVSLSLAAAACGARAPVLTAQRTGDGFAFEARDERGFAVAVLASRLLGPETPPERAWEGSVLDASASCSEPVPPFVLGLSRPGAKPSVVCRVPESAVPRGTFAVQAVALSLADGRVATRWSNAFVLDRDAAGVRLRGYGIRLVETYGPWWLLASAAIAALALGTRALRIPADRRPRIGSAVLAAAALALLVPRLWRIPEQCTVESGGAVPPLLWQPEWPLGGDSIEQRLGPGYLALESAAREAQGPDDPITIVVKEGAFFEGIRGIYLANRLPRATLIFDPAPCPRGLAIFLGRPADGRSLARCEFGTLARVEAEPR